MTLRHLAFLSLSLLVLSACAGRKSARIYHTRIYDGNYDQVWDATLKTLRDYPLKLSNKDSGRIETEVVNGPYNDLLFAYPDKLEVPERFRYTVGFNFAKYASEDDRPLTRIRAIKNLERFQDFYVGWTPYPSDGLEERVLLYRVQHILQMEKRLTKAAYQKDGS